MLDLLSHRCEAEQVGVDACRCGVGGHRFEGAEGGCEGERAARGHLSDCQQDWKEDRILAVDVGHGAVLEICAHIEPVTG